MPDQYTDAPEAQEPASDRPTSDELLTLFDELKDRFAKAFSEFAEVDDFLKFTATKNEGQYAEYLRGMDKDYKPLMLPLAANYVGAGRSQVLAGERTADSDPSPLEAGPGLA